MGTVKRNSRIETELPLELRQAVNRLLLEPGTTYDDIGEFLRARGHDISRSSIGRYGKQYLEAYQKIKQFEDQAKGITTDADDGMPMEEAIGKLMLQKVMEALVDGTVDITENSKMISAVARLQSSHIQLAKWKADVEGNIRRKERERLQKETLDAVDQATASGPMTAEALKEKIREVYGV